MFNDFAAPRRCGTCVWRCCTSPGTGTRATTRPPPRAGSGTLGEAAAEACAGGDVDAPRAPPARRAASLGPKLFPSDAAFPVAHVALRLELLAAGLWRRSAASSSQKMGGRLSEAARKWAPSFWTTRWWRRRCCVRRATLSRRRTPRTTGSSPRRTRCTARTTTDACRRTRVTCRRPRCACACCARRCRRCGGGRGRRRSGAEPALGFGAYGGWNRRARAALADTARGRGHASCCRCPRASRAPPRRWRRSLRRWDGGLRRRDARL